MFSQMEVTFKRYNKESIISQIKDELFGEEMGQAFMHEYHSSKLYNVSYYGFLEAVLDQYDK